jgi:hypothetical protein
LPRRAPSHSALAITVSKHALTSAVVPALRAAWASYRTALSHRDQIDRATHGGRAPDFGDPAQVILGMDAGVESILSVLEGAAGVELDVDPFPSRLEATLRIAPDPGSPAQALFATLGAGDAKAFLSLPADTRLALGISRSPSERDEAAKAAGDDWVRFFGPRLAARDAQALRGVLADWEFGRGARTDYGFLGGADPGVFVVTDVADAARLKHAGHGFFGLLALPSLRAPLSEFLGEPRITESVAPHGELAPDVQLARVVFASHGKAAPPPPLSCAWFVADKTGFAVSGKNAERVLKKVVLAARGTDASLGSLPGIPDGVQRMGDQAALTLYGDARALAPASDSAPPMAPPEPVFVSVGKRDSSAFLRIEISKPAVSQVLDRAEGR